MEPSNPSKNKPISHSDEIASISTTLKKVYAFTSEFTGVKIEKLTPETTLEKGLGITGDDAEEFILKFSQDFNVDIQSFRFDKHFSGELVGGWALIGFIFGFKNCNPPAIPICLRDLETAAESRKWPFSYENSDLPPRKGEE